MTAYTLFTSYRRADGDYIDRLERQMRLHGLRSWRDVRNIPHGSATAEQIRCAIASETDGLVAFVTKPYLERHRDREDLVWDIELPDAAQRWTTGTYGVTPFFFGTRARALADRCAAEHLPDLAGANGRVVPGDLAPDTLEAEFRAEARAQLANALAGRGQELVAAFRSFSMASLPGAAFLDIDWARDVDGSTEHAWARDLLPALDDLADALGTARVRKLDLHVLARLDAALPFGMKLPLSTGITITPYGRDGERWDPRAGADGARPLREERLERAGKPNVAVVELGIVRDLARDAATLAETVGAGIHQRLFHVEPTRSWDVRSAAGAVADQIGDAVRGLRSRGASEYHLLLASPAPLAVLIGRQLKAIGRVHVYYRAESGAITRAFSATA